MKAGRTLTELATELERQRKAKKDFIVRPWAMEMELEGTIGLGERVYEVTENAHKQIAEYTGIPAGYYNRMLAEDRKLLANNVNAWMHRDADAEPRMVRTLDNRVRALLSRRFRPLDNFDLAEVALPSMIQDAGCRVESCEITETHLYIKAVTERIQGKVRGDVVQAGISISNSEVGAGSLRIEPLIYTLACTNGMIAADHSIRKFHVGRGQSWDGEDIRELLSDEARVADDRAFWLKARDVIASAFQQEVFTRLIAKLEQAAGNKIISNDIPAVVDVTAKMYSMSETVKDSVLRHLIEDGQLTQYGLLNAVTRASQDVPSYDTATDLERAGGSILELPAHEWDRISRAEKAAA